MTVRAVEGKQPYTGGTAIEITEDKVINLRLRAENNLIIYDEGDDEIYVDLQLPDEITPTDAFPVGITTGRVIVDNGWDVQGTIICAKTTSGDNIKILYADDGKLYMDNGTGSFKQIYFKADVDLITSSLQEQIDVLSGLGKFLSLWDCASGEPMSFPLETPYTYSTGDYYLVGNVSSATPPVDYRPTGSEWDDVASQTAETEVVEIGDVYIYDGTVWLLQKNSASGGTGNVVGPNSATDGHIAVFNGATGKIIRDGGPIPTGDVGVSTDTGTLLSAGVDLWLGTETDFSSISTPDTNTLYIQYKSDSTPRTPGADTVAYRPLADDYNDHSGNNYNITSQGSTTLTTLNGVKCLDLTGGPCVISSLDTLSSYSNYTMSLWCRLNNPGAIGWNYSENGSRGGGGITLRDSNGQIRRGNMTNKFTQTPGSTTNVRFHYVLTVLNGEGSIYVNGVKTVLLSTGALAPNHNGTPMRIGANESGSVEDDGYVSNLIIEKKGWTQQDVLDYFNSTKGDYGIS